ncbi:voltage-dependent calcium channel subunit alpha-2/delta-2 isoform X4 [Lepeophtheirus salmonis]|uniref:voltage-dependent calcium channel subunit alpha-2/delta-2 isoform X4 n=1 Tax=Lepeophtheirus salmonis TaxID=72036 RepID=UPI001AE9B886|nr:voltage-dependent calcium channel subunit alpha-2/delta-2-like isoform X4 [Lepeophtheirus salmonis]
MATSVEKSRLANYSKSIGIQRSVSFFIMFYYVLILFCLHSVESQTFPSAETAKSWSLRIDEAFKKISSGDGDLTGAETFQKKFQDNIGESVIVSTDGKKIAETVSKEITRIFDYNIKALKNLVSNIEGLVKNYKYNDDLSIGNLSNYLNMAKSHETNSADFAYDPKFKQDVNLKQSGVHIPLEIYEGYNSNQMSRICIDCISVCDLCDNGMFWQDHSSNLGVVQDPDILNGIEWSGALDDVLKDNYKKYPGVYWQSFGSQTGFLRVYPAARWQSSIEHPDLFDVRRRPWYIHGSVTPKDMIILLDTSGSMHGQSFDIMKLAAKMLINTLGEDDYFNVASFDRNVSWVTPCLDTLVQANSRNKRLIFDGIDQLEARYIASYTDGLNFAYDNFEQFERTKEEEEGAECHKLVMVFSDGGTIYPEKVINYYRNQTLTENVRIFSYAVGPHPLPTVALKTMACRTGGAFTTITAMGAIRTKVQDSYLNVIARPQVLNKIHTLQFTSVYADALGLGLITTVTYPVFNTSDGSDNQTLAGVVGIDIPVNDLEALIPRRQLGALGYGFALNQNGFLVFHPKLWSFMNYFEDPSHVDFADVVGESEPLRTVRKQMIDEIQGSSTIEIDHEVLEFNYFHVPNSSFSVGIVNPENWSYIKPGAEDINIISDMLSLIENADIAPWIYCNENGIIKNQNLTWLIKQIKKGKCESKESLHHLSWDVKNALPVFKSLMAQNLSPHDFPSRFVQTEGGFTIHTGFDELSNDPYNSTIYKVITKYSRKNFDQPFLYLDKKQNQIKNRILPKYKIDHDEFIFNDAIEIVTRPELVKNNPVEDFEERAQLHLVKPFFVKQGNNQFMAGISGIELSYEYLAKIFSDATSEIKTDEYNCFNNTELRCEIIDISGSILHSNREDVALGDFLGSVDPNLMRHMVEKLEIFVDENPIINYQALCPDSFECTASGVKVLPFSLDQAVKVWYSFLGVFQALQIVITSFLTTIYSFSEGSFGLSQFNHKVQEGIHRCTTKTSVWTINPNLKKSEFHDRMTSTCRSETECKRDLHMFKLKNINGLFVVSNPECAHCNAPPFPKGPVEIMATENCLLPHRYRKRQSGCFAQSDMETSECSKGSINLPGLWKTLILMYLSLLSPIFLRKLL